MKNLLLILLVNFFCMALNAQTEKDNFIISGSGYGFFINRGSDHLYLQLNPKIGEFALDNVALTLSLPLSHERIRGGSFWNYRTSYSAGLLPGFQYYIPITRKIYFTPQFKVGYEFVYLKESGRPINIEKLHLFKLEAGPGAAWFLAPQTALTVDLPIVGWIDINDTMGKNSKFDFLIGFLVSFPPKHTD